MSARPTLALMIAAVLATSGCGGDSSSPAAGGGSATVAEAEGGKQGPRVGVPSGAPEAGITPVQRAQATVASIELSIPAIGPGREEAGRLPLANTCDGANGWPALSWRGVPPGTAELALFAMSLQPVRDRLFVDWAVAGLDPRLKGLGAGHLPDGAVVGRNGFGRIGYSICPEAGHGETYIFAVYALPKRLSPSRGFDPVSLRKEVLRISGSAGLVATSYARG